MERRFDGEIKEVKASLTKMSYLAMEQIRKSLRAFEKKDFALAKEVIDGDREVDALNKSIEDKALRILLLDAPVAKDFRNVSASLKMITDLERIGDYAVDIAEEVLTFPNEPYLRLSPSLPEIGEEVIEMVNKAIRCYVNEDPEEAKTLDRDDDQVDKDYYQIKKELIRLIREKEENSEQAILFMMIAKYLERIGDHAVNLGEWVDYVSTGELPPR